MVQGPLLVPPARSPIADAKGLAPSEWYEFFRRLLAYLQQTGVDPAVIADILARLDALEASELGPFLILGPLSVQVQGTPAAGNVLVQLENDEATPAASYYYGTDPAGAKGFYPATDLSIYLVDGDGNYLVDENGNFLTDGPSDNHNALNNVQVPADAVDGQSYHLSKAQADAVAAAISPGGGFVTVAGAQTVTGAKTFTGMTRFQNGSTSGSVVFGADVNASTVTDGARKLFRGTIPTFSSGTIAPMFIFGADADSANSKFIRFGGWTGATGMTAALDVRFGCGSVADEIGGVDRWGINATAFRPIANVSYDLGTNSLRPATVYTRDLNIGATANSFGGGVGVGFIGNATTAPTTTPTGGVVLFSESGSLKGMFTDGRVQTIAATSSKIITVYTLSDLPAASGGVITLADNTSYYITAAIDVGANRIQCGLNNSLHGDDADNCSLTATGLSAATAFITSTSSLSIQSITIKDVGTALSLNDSTNQLAWRNVRFQNIPTMGTIQNYANIVWGQCILENSANLTIQGTIGSIAFFECLFDGRTGQTTLTVPSTAVITRRLRMLYCAVACLAGETAFNVSASATIPDEGYILDNVAFAGGGTYLAGLDYTSNKALFFNNSGIQNTSVLCQYSMTGNATATVIGASGNFVKVAGTTTASSLNQKFTTATTQRATYAGVTTANFRVVAFASMTSGNNQTLRMRVAKNGTTVTESNTLFKTTGSGEASAVGCQVILTMAPTDYIELFVTNDTAATNITVSDLNLTITRL